MNLARSYLRSGMWMVMLIVVAIGLTTKGITYWAPALGIQIVLGLWALYEVYWKKSRRS